MVRQFLFTGIFRNPHLLLSQRIYKIFIRSIWIRIRSPILCNIGISVLCINLNIIPVIFIVKEIIFSGIHGQFFRPYQFSPIRFRRIKFNLIVEGLGTSPCSIYSYIPNRIEIILGIICGLISPIGIPAGKISPTGIIVKENTAVYICRTGLQCHFRRIYFCLHMDRHVLFYFFKQISAFGDFHRNREFIVIFSQALFLPINFFIFHLQHTGCQIITDIRLKKNSTA